MIFTGEARRGDSLPAAEPLLIPQNVSWKCGSSIKPVRDYFPAWAVLIGTEEAMKVGPLD
jgi:hypothetical protein